MIKSKLTKEQILENASKMDAAQFDQFLDKNEIEFAYNECCITDLNDGVYEVILTDMDDTQVIFINGTYIPD